MAESTKVGDIPEGDPLILVTGASGYIATHVVQQLQWLGYRVRGTVRSTKNDKKCQPIRDLCKEARVPVELVEADLTKEEGWLEAVQGCTYVIHMASPFPAQNPEDEDELIRPAVDGTLSVLKAVRAAGGVKRVVLTSSAISISGGFNGSKQDYTEKDWTDLEDKDLIPYGKSKTLAERAAWDFVEELPEKEKFELTTINPCYVIGPVLIDTFTTSMEIIKRMMEHTMPALPKLNFAVVDVRDVARAHIAAMKIPEAAGNRHIASTGNMWMADIAHIIDEEFRSQGYSIPTRTVPKFFIWLNSLIDSSIKLVLPSIGKVTKFDNTRMKETLGISPLDMKDSVLDMCYSMVEHGHVKKTPKYQPRQSAPKAE